MKQETWTPYCPGTGTKHQTQDLATRCYGDALCGHERARQQVELVMWMGLVHDCDCGRESYYLMEVQHKAQAGVGAANIKDSGAKGQS